MTDTLHKDNLAKLIEDALKAIPGLDARNIVIGSLRTDYNAEADCSKARLEMTFEFR